MSQNEDFDRHGASDQRPHDWPTGVFQISIDGMGHLGVHEKTGRLYWKGKELITKRVIGLRPFELLLAALASFGTFGYFVLEVGKVVDWW